MGTSSDDLAFERTWHRLALPAEQTAGLPLDATITSRTLAAPAAAADPAPAQRALPRISIGAQAPGGGATPALGPDLIVVGVLGEGGMGRVELVRQRSLDRDVAVKRPRAGASELDTAALRHEALVTGHLEHPNIIPVHAFGRDDGEHPLMVMKRVEGVSWRELIHDDDHPAWARRERSPAARLTWHLETLGQVANAVAFAHSRGVVHRDIKPDNVMIGEFGEVYLLDWGLATRAADTPPAGSASLVGTPAYMAPEMVEGDACDERTDVYLLGATLHEILTREVRHAGTDLETVLRRAFASDPAVYGDDVSPELAALANQATARDPAARPASALAFREALLESVRHRGSLALSAAADAHMRAGQLDEARFAYRLALRDWPDNRAARAGLETLEARDAAAEAERERLRSMEREGDPRAGSGTRLASMIAMTIAATLVSLYAIAVEMGGRKLTATQVIGFPALLCASTIATVVLFRRRLLVNAFNRRLSAWFVALLAILVLNRALGQYVGLSTAQQLVMDMVGLTSAVVAGSIFVFRWLWWCAVMEAAGAVVGALYPEWAFLTFCVVGLGGTVFAVEALRRGQRTS